eukprot:2094342-Amphidinium_carterae.1
MRFEEGKHLLRACPCRHPCHAKSFRCVTPVSSSHVYSTQSQLNLRSAYIMIAARMLCAVVPHEEDMKAFLLFVTSQVLDTATRSHVKQNGNLSILPLSTSCCQ